ncbi:MAG: transketolase, partial [Alphaproteobacteria bacterium]|nr:transketolase [Alphaproteobacteria bacterium]
MNLTQMAHAVRFLSVDMVEKAKSGHPGAPLGLADVMAVLWAKFLNICPAQPLWHNRDRFVLSNGHASAMLYSLMHVSGFADMTLDELKNFRQWGSKTPGHPERQHLAGVDFSTGPLGQGVAGAVGLALAERIQHARYGRLVDHKTYCVAGDGCLMEGITQEAIDLAGHWKLKNLILLWDDNGITIDGAVALSGSTWVPARFKAAGWRVLACDGHDFTDIERALAAAQKSTKPTLIDCRTQIGYGAPTKCGTANAHGSPLGAEEVARLREILHWPHAPFDIPADIRDDWRRVMSRGDAAYARWAQALDKSRLKRQLTAELSGAVPESAAEAVRQYARKAAAAQETLPTRKCSQQVLSKLAAQMPNLIGGSADLDAACFTKTPHAQDIRAGRYAGNYLHYGVREHAMAGIMNGLAAHGGLIPYGGTFLAFSDYMKPAMRLAAMMGLRVIYVFTHDSVGLGEDGPTHQPVEHLTALRAMPGIRVFRPADGVEVAESYLSALAFPGPSAIVLTRQAVPPVRREAAADETAHGAYVLVEAAGARQATIIATGSEVSPALAAREELGKKGIRAAVVSAPCLEIFDAQPAAYRQ